jgi:hypothetical protein
VVTRVQLNWMPIVFNRLLRVFRFQKYPWVIYKQQKELIQQSFKLKMQKLQLEIKKLYQDDEQTNKMYGLPMSDERKYHRKKVKERMMNM